MLADRIIPLCKDAFKGKGTTFAGGEWDFFVHLKNKAGYTIDLDVADVEEDEREGVNLTDLDSEMPSRLTNHVQVLDACLAALHTDPELAAGITFLTTDGDGKDCEAIFVLEEVDYVLKVR